MDKELKIEHYLLQLDRELSALPVSQRAEIITEIKSHIRDAQERDPKRTLESVLEDLGTPRTVAERYLSAKGLTGDQRPVRQGAGPWLKWIAIGTASLFIFSILMGAAALYYFSPFLVVDETKGRVSLLGGTIDLSVDEDLSNLRVGGAPVGDAFKDGKKLQGEEDFGGRNVRLLRIPFNSAKLEVYTGQTRRLVWECKSTTLGETPQVEFNAGIATLNLDALNIAKCTISLPNDLRAELKGVNGKVDVHGLRSDLDIDLSNGKVNIEPDPKRTYDFDVRVKNGLQDFFPRSSAKDAVKVKVNVVNGLVKKD